MLDLVSWLCFFLLSAAYPQAVAGHSPCERPEDSVAVASCLIYQLLIGGYVVGAGRSIMVLMYQSDTSGLQEKSLNEPKSEGH